MKKVTIMMKISVHPIQAKIWQAAKNKKLKTGMGCINLIEINL